MEKAFSDLKIKMVIIDVPLFESNLLQFVNGTMEGLKGWHKS
jgi:hypothetical protein